MVPDYRNRKLAAVLIARSANSVRLLREEEARAIATPKSHFQVMHESVGKFQGRVVDSPGGSLLAEFDSVVDAVQCAMEIQENLHARDEALSEADRIPFRIGIHLGEVTEEEGTIRGEGVDVAALLEGLADAGGICISRSAYDQVTGKVPAEYESLGAHHIQGIAEPVRAYRVVRKPGKTGRAILMNWILSHLKSRLDIAHIVISGLLVLVGIGELYNSYFRERHLPVEVASVQRMALPLPNKPSLAVLPFDNMTGDSKQEYFSDGFTEQIITSLSKIPALFVISRNSSFTYKGKPVKVQQVSEELGVRYVLEGSLQKFSSRIRVNVQLIDAISGRHVWAQSYDRDLKDIFRLQDELILKIASALSVNLTVGEQARAWAEGTKSLEAYLKLMQGNEYLLQGNRESLALARRMAEEAIALDPRYANAYALLGATHMSDVWLGTSNPKQSIGKAIELTQKALTMNRSLADARSRLGVLYSWSGKYEEGIAEAERGVELDPNSAMANFFLAGILRYAGRSKEAIPIMQKALRLSPFAPDIYVQNLALIYFQAGDCQEAIATCEKGLTRQRDNLNSRAIRAAIYGYCGKEEEARKEATEVLRINPKFTVESYTKIIPYKNPSNRELTALGLRKAGLP